MPARRWLEVGCGRGIVVDFLRRSGLDVDGVELAETRPVCDGITCGTAAGDLPNRADYDGVLLLDVIEHIDDAVAFLEQMRSDIPHASSLIVAVPARMEIWSNYDERFGHFRRYTRTMLREELTRAGWVPQRVFYGFRPLYPAARLTLAMKGARATAVSAPRTAMQPIHALIGGALYAESMLPLGGVPGTSVFATAHRSPTSTKSR